MLFNTGLVLVLVDYYLGSCKILDVVMNSINYLHGTIVCRDLY